MADNRVTVRLSNTDEELIEQYAADEDIGKSTALRRGFREGMAAQGYDTARGRNGATRLEWLSNEAWRASLWAAGALVIADVAGPVGFAVEAAALLVAAMVFQLVAFNEPAVSDRLRRGRAVADGGEPDG